MKVFISNKEIEEIAYGLIQVTCGSPASGSIDIDGIARFLGLQVHYERIAEEDRDKIGFVSNGSYPLSVLRQNQRVGIVFPKDTIILDSFYSGLLKTAADGLFLPMKSAIFSSTGQTRFTIRPALTGNMTASANTAFESCKNG